MAWVFFRAESVTDAIYILRETAYAFKSPGILLKNCIGLIDFKLAMAFVAICILGVYDYLSLKFDVISKLAVTKPIIKYSVYIILVWIILLFMPGTGTNEFVYFQF